jgi:hypothetical protein
MSVDFSIPYLLKDENYRIGGWTIELSTWLGALERADHRPLCLPWKGALAHVASAQRIKLIETYDSARGVRVAKWFYSHVPKILAAARALAFNLAPPSAAPFWSGRPMIGGVIPTSPLKTKRSIKPCPPLPVVTIGWLNIWASGVNGARTTGHQL